MTGPQAPPEDATVGKRILVNGQFAPYLRVKPGPLPAASPQCVHFSAYDFALSNGRPFVQVGTGNGLLPKQRGPPRRSSRPRPACRRGRRLPGPADQNILLSTDPAQRRGVGTGSRSAAIMQFRVRGRRTSSHGCRTVCGPSRSSTCPTRSP